jgi:prepilin-type N-terminal cleavage/methylation domain-containing protein
MELINPTIAIDVPLICTENGGKPRRSRSLDSRPFTGVSAAGGIRPGIYAGLVGRCDDILSGPFTGLLIVGAASRRFLPGKGVNRAAGRRSYGGVNAGPSTAFGGKGRKRPSESLPGRLRPIVMPRRADAAAKRKSPNLQISKSPNLQITSPHSPRSGFTLIEMLVVIGILMMMVAAAATLMQPAGESRRIREAARGVNLYLSSARNHALETGRPCGVIFRSFTTTDPGFVLNADQCEEPPCYTGDADGSTIQVQRVSQTDLKTFSARFTNNDQPSTDVVKVGDTIQFNEQGYLYTITSTGGTMTVKLTEPSSVVTPWPTSNWSAAMPYKIFRSPVKGGAAPLQLPAASVIDLEASGYGSNYVGHQDLTVMFSPTGSVDSVYYGATRLTANEPIYLLIGKRERVKSKSDFVQNETKETNLANWQDLNNLWVVVNVQTGQIATEPMASDGGASTADDSIVAARGLAKEGQGMGGR